jgi:hypothetical protein
MATHLDLPVLAVSEMQYLWKHSPAKATPEGKDHGILTAGGQAARIRWGVAIGAPSQDGRQSER